MVAFAVMLMRWCFFALLAGLASGLGLGLAPAVLAQAPVTAFVGATQTLTSPERPGLVGTLQPGAWADLAVYTASPASDIRNTKTLASVWVSGEKLP